MSKKIVAYCGFDDKSRNGYLKWDRSYLGMTDAQKLQFITSVVDELLDEHEFLVRLIDNQGKPLVGLRLPQ